MNFSYVTTYQSIRKNSIENCFLSLFFFVLQNFDALAHSNRYTSMQESYRMARGPIKHLKRLAAPSHWQLGKMAGVFVSLEHKSTKNAKKHGIILVFFTHLCINQSTAGSSTVDWSAQVARVLAAVFVVAKSSEICIDWP